MISIKFSYVAVLPIILLGIINAQSDLRCPLETTRCYDGSGISYLPTDDDVPKCWSYSRNSNRNGIWRCNSQSSQQGCDYYDLDITSCNYSRNQACPDPNLNEMCRGDDGRGYRLQDDNVPPCWRRERNGWKCSTVQNWLDNSCATNSVDVRKCSKSNQAKCPAKGTWCRADNGQIHFSGNRNQLPCWQFINNSWRCFNYVNYNCPYSPQVINIGACYNDNSNCPSESSYCIDRNGLAYIATDNKAPPCWSKYDSGWRCVNFNNYQSQSCPNQNMVNIRDCFNGNNECPNRNEVCRDRYGQTFSANDRNKLPCWWKSNNGWSCENYINDRCNSDPRVINVNSCTLN